MNFPYQAMWQDEYLDEIRKLDQEQAPHGLYGMREMLANEFRKKGEKHLPPLSKLLGSKGTKTGIARRLDWGAGDNYCWRFGKTSEEGFFFTLPGGGSVHLRLETHASTKVRHYGDSYVLDKVHGKKPAESPEFLESAVPRVRKEARSAVGVPGLLFIAHIHTPRGFTELLGKTSDECLLERYGLSYHSRTWEDIHGRGFHTGLFLWVAEASG